MSVCFMLERYDLNQGRAEPEKPNECCSLVKRIVGSIVSKAAERYKSVKMQILLLSRAVRLSLKILSRAVSVIS